ncbi:hypothetical protein [Streptomyces sp. NBC_01727]|uniref:hypothetical protein n=1 Tax=Streptomyces sp. NBC_01727 TaxID=2975924 RepID=UPI002E0F1747
MTNSPVNPAPAPVFSALQRHFVDLRDGVHGDGAYSQASKERLFIATFALLDHHARQVLDDMNAELLLSTGIVLASGVHSTGDGDLLAIWELTWPEQRSADLPSVSL